MTPFEVIAFTLLGMLAVGLVALVLSVLWSASRLQRTVEVLARTPCPVCREPLGMEAVQTGRRRTVEFQQEIVEGEPSAAIDLPPHWHLLCERCSSELVFDWDQREWVTVKHPHEID